MPLAARPLTTPPISVLMQGGRGSRAYALRFNVRRGAGDGAIGTFACRGRLRARCVSPRGQGPGPLAVRLAVALAPGPWCGVEWSGGGGGQERGMWMPTQVYTLEAAAQRACCALEGTVF